MESKAAIDEWRREQEKHYYDPGEPKQPNYTYDITPRVYPLSNSDDCGRTHIRTDAQGQVIDTIKSPSTNERRKNPKADDKVVPNKDNIPQRNGKNI